MSASTTQLQATSAVTAPVKLLQFVMRNQQDYKQVHDDLCIYKLLKQEDSAIKKYLSDSWAPQDMKKMKELQSLEEDVIAALTAAYGLDDVKKNVFSFKQEDDDGTLLHDLSFWWEEDEKRWLLSL